MNTCFRTITATNVCKCICACDEKIDQRVTELVSRDQWQERGKKSQSPNRGNSLFFRSCGCTMRYSLICRLYALCNSQSYSKHVVKVTWLTWLKITKRNVFFSIIIWPILKTMSTKDILTVQSAIEYQTHFQSICIYVHNSAYIHGLSLTHMLYITWADEREEEKSTNSLNAPLVSLAARRNTVQFFFTI